MPLFKPTQVQYPVAGKSMASRFTVDLDNRAALVVGRMVYHQIERCVYRVERIDAQHRSVVLLNEVSGQRISDFWGNVIPCKLQSNQLRKATYLATSNGG